MIPIRYIGSYRRDFNDLNDLHLSEAKKIGITPLTSRHVVKEAVRKMVKIESNDYLTVQKLNYSIPYLVPEAASLLEDIAEAFCDTLANHNATAYKLKVTSLTRTKEDVRNLKKRNYNATENSAHMFGTTFDISWSKYIKVNPKDTLMLGDDVLKRALASVLRSMRRNKRCYVKHERRQGCFHITARDE